MTKAEAFKKHLEALLVRLEENRDSDAGYVRAELDPNASRNQFLIDVTVEGETKLYKMNVTSPWIASEKGMFYFPKANRVSVR